MRLLPGLLAFPSGTSKDAHRVSPLALQILVVNCGVTKAIRLATNANTSWARENIAA